MAGYEGFSPKPFTATHAEQEEAFVKVGCGSKGKAEEDREEAPAAELLKGDDETTDEVVYSDSDSDSDDDDPETCIAKCAARFEEHVRQNRARMPWLKYNDYSLEMEEEEDSGSDDDGAVVDLFLQV